MTWSYTDLIPLTLLSSILAFSIAFYSLGKHNTRNTLSFSILMLSVAIWSLAATMELISQNPATKIFWSQVSYLGICSLGPSWLLFAIQFTESKCKNKLFWFIILYSISLIILILALTNSFHHLVWKETIEMTNAHGNYILYHHNIIVKINSVYTYGLFLTGITLFIYHWSKDRKFYGWNTVIFILAGLIPLITNAFYMLSDADIVKFDLTPVSFSITGLLIAIGIFRYNFLRVLPVAYKSLFNNMQDAVIVIDNNFNIKAANPVFYKMAGINDYDNTSFNESLVDLSDQIKSNIQNQNSQFEYICKRFTPAKYFDIFINPIIERNQKADNYLIVIHDISTRKTFELELNESKNKIESFSHTQSKLLSIISHDFKNSLGGISNAIQFLLMNPEVSDEDKTEFLQEMLKSSDNIYILLENLLEWGRIKSNGFLKPELYFYESIVNSMIEVVKLNGFRKNITINTEIEPGLQVFADKAILSTVLRNLLSNAIKYSYNSGIITISAYKNEQAVIIKIKDEGVGIPESKLRMIFLMDYQSSSLGTANEKGHGFGLFLCKELIDLHKGKIWAESVQGKGSSFYVELPVNDNQ